MMCDISECASKSRSPLPIVSQADRRAFVKGAIALPIASVLAHPSLVKAAANRTEMISFEGNGVAVQGAIAIPETDGPAPTVILIHEWWGLNDHIKAVAADFAAQGYVAFAIDLYDGKVATTREDAMAYRKAMDTMVATQQLQASVEWLRNHEKSSGKVGTVGWCFGGGWSLNTALVTDVDATVIYYGRVNKSASELAPLKSPVLGHFGTLDKFINEEMVSGFEAALKEAGKTDVTIYWYDADHAFANPTGSRYDEADAKLSWERTQAFLQDHLA